MDLCTDANKVVEKGLQLGKHQLDSFSDSNICKIIFLEGWVTSQQEIF